MIQRRRKQIYSLDAKLYLCDDAYDFLLREVEEILEDLANQVLEERKKWSSLSDQYRNKRKELRKERHDALDALHKLRLAFAESQYALYFLTTEHCKDVNEIDYVLKRLRFWTQARNNLAYTEMLRQKGIPNDKIPIVKKLNTK